MKIYKICFSCILLAFLVAGCSDVKDANEKNFKTAVQAYLDTEYPYGYLLINLPYTPNISSSDKILSTLDVLAKLGLVTKAEVSGEHIPSPASGEGSVKMIYAYELTDKGEIFYKADIAKNWLNKDLGGFAFGKAKVEKIINFTEPTDYFGYKVSHVTYTYSVSDIPEWAQDKDLLDLDSTLKADVESQKTPVQETDVFILTNSGWVHEGFVKTQF